MRSGVTADLKHVIERRGDTVAIYISGVVDFATAPLLRSDIDSCAESDAAKVELHFGAIDLMDSSGLSALIHAYKTMREHGKDLAFVGREEVVARLLERTSLDRVIKIEPESDEGAWPDLPAASA